jgi:hypothetical protein
MTLVRDSEPSIREFPLRQRPIVDAVRIGRRRDTTHGLVEFDVTDARRRISTHMATTGEQCSFTAFVVHRFA